MGGRECIMPEVDKVCDSKQMVNSVVTGILTPILGWLLVRCIFNGLPPRVRQVQNYLYHSGSKHASDKNAGAASGAWVPPKGHKLMLLEVPEGGGPMSGTPINPDIMQTGNSAMASYANQGYPSSIVVDQTSAMLSSYQSQSPGGM